LPKARSLADTEHELITVAVTLKVVVVVEATEAALTSARLTAARNLFIDAIRFGDRSGRGR
jgi:hypothetical protein